MSQEVGHMVPADKLERRQLLLLPLPVLFLSVHDKPYVLFVVLAVVDDAVVDDGDAW